MGIFDWFGGGGTPDPYANPYAAQRGLFGVFSAPTAGRIAIAGNVIGNLANNQSTNVAPMLGQLNRQEMARQEVERKYDSAMRYADKLEASNPEYAEAIRADWTLANFMQKEKMKHDLDPTIESEIALNEAKRLKAESEAAIAKNRQGILQDFFGVGASSPESPGPSSPSAQSTAPAAPQAPVSSPPEAVAGAPSPGTQPNVYQAPPPPQGAQYPPGGAPAPQRTAPAPTPQQAASVPSRPSNMSESMYNRAMQFAQQGGLEPTPQVLSQISNAMLEVAMSKTGVPATKLNTVINNLKKQQQERTEFDQAQLTRTRAEEARPAQIEYMRRNGVPDSVISGLKTNEQVNDAFNKIRERVENPEVGAAAQIAEEIAPGNKRVRNLFMNSPDLAKQEYKRYQDANTGPDAEFKKQLFKPTVSMEKMPDGSMRTRIRPWTATENNIDKLQSSLGIRGLTKSDAMRLRYSNNVGETLNQIMDEKSQDDKAKKSTATTLRQDLKKERKRAEKAVAAATRTKKMIEDGTIENNPSAALPIMYDSITLLDDTAAKEGEVALATRAQSAADTLRTYVKQIESGAILSDKALKNMSAIILSYGDAAQEKLGRLDDEYRGFADAYDVPHEMVIGKREADEAGKFKIENLEQADNKPWTGGLIDESMARTRSGSGLD